MAATTKGTAHLFGASGTVSNATVLSFRETLSPAVSEFTEDESGVVIEHRLDDLTQDASITIRQRSGYTAPAIGTTVTYNTVAYYVVSVEKSEQNKGFREITLTLRKSEGVTS
jgi:hypothetical protein